MAQYSASSRERSVSIVVVGAGFIAGQHAAAVRQHPGAELIGIVDVDAGKAETAARELGGLRWTTDLAEALAWPVDAVVVCTPNHTHRAIGVDIAAAGKHLLVEKPLATTVGDAQQLAAAFAASGSTLMAAHTHRFYDYARTIKREITSGAVGRPVFARLALLGGWIWPDWRAWMIDPVASGGHALHNGVHLLDLVSWWFDDRPDAIYARGRKQTAAELGIYDYLEMTVEFASGGTAVCEMSRGHRPTRIDRRDAMVIGTDGVLSMPPDQWGAPLITDDQTAALPPAAGNGFVAQLDAWLTTVAGGPAAMTSDEAVTATALGVAAERSIELGRPVTVDEVCQGAAA